MRAMLLAILLVCRLGAEDESFTLKDGRTLIGTYDEVAQTVRLRGVGSATVHVAPSDITHREAAPPDAPAKARLEPIADAAPQGMPPKAARALSMAKQITEQKAKADAEQAKYVALRNEQATNVSDALHEFFETADLSPVPVTLPPNPSDQDLEEARRGKAFNDTMNRLHARKADPEKRKSYPDVLDGLGMDMYEFARMYSDRKHVPWIRQLLSRRDD